MHDELVKRLRNEAETERYLLPHSGNETAQLLDEAADAIVKLTDIRVGKWIPVTERLPQETQRCIVVSKCGEIAIAIYNEMGFQYPCYMGKATHWMPLPEPPKEE